MDHAALIQRAAACDTAGDHEAAIQWLIKAAQAGATEAWLQLGRRHLLGDRASFSPAHAIQLVEHAAQLGSAEAAHQLAVLYALGLHLAQDWHKALSLLVASAELGWTDARQQLQLLGSKDETPSEDWAALALSIDLDFWHSPAQDELLSHNPRIG
ncbi:MAG TPA: sel1 repeat family protein, partial [Pseudomonadaceae bacterium]|nr:sel1 repeat family protein [Pseudomonadaceae bacterium]